MRKSKNAFSMAKPLLSSDKRNSIRFEPDVGTLALLDFRDASTARIKKTVFAPSVTALVTEESHRGCGLVLKTTRELEVGSICRVKVGHGPVLLGEVRWRVDLDSQIIRVGLMFLD
jgi:hypothetical protein